MKSDDIDNEELTRLLRKFGKAGDRSREALAAHRKFYDHIARVLDRQALQATNYNEDLAAAAVQDAWLRILRKAETYDPSRATVKTWVKDITYKSAVDVLRKYYKHNRNTSLSNEDAVSDASQDAGHESAVARSGADRWLAPVSDPDEMACDLPSPEDNAYGSQLERVMRACLDTLPSGDGPNYRLAMELTLEEDLSYADMTVRLQDQTPPGVTINAEQVRGWVRQATQRMRRCVAAKLGWTSPQPRGTSVDQEETRA